jgi:aminoglycoside 6'-N-acetyltransferase
METVNSLLFQFQPLARHHLPLLVKWLNEPHVWEWWGEGKTWSLHDVEAKYASYLHQYKMDRGVKKPIHAFIIFHQDTPVGYIQYYNAFDFPREGFELKDVWHEPSTSLAALDFYIGDSSCLGKGIGTGALKAFLDTHLWHKFSACLVDPAKENAQAVKAYKKAGFKLYLDLGAQLVLVNARTNQNA